MTVPGSRRAKTFRRMVTEGGMQLIDWEQSRQSSAPARSASSSPRRRISPGHRTRRRQVRYEDDDVPGRRSGHGRIPTGGNAAMTFTQGPGQAEGRLDLRQVRDGPGGTERRRADDRLSADQSRASGPEFLGPFYDKNPNEDAVPQIDRAGPWGAYPGGNTVRIWRAQRDMIGQVMRGDKPPEAGLAEIVKTTRDMIKANESIAAGRRRPPRARRVRRRQHNHLKIIHITITHIRANGQTIYGARFGARLRGRRRQCEHAARRCRLAVITGDLAHYRRARAYARLVEILRRAARCRIG